MYEERRQGRIRKARKILGNERKLAGTAGHGLLERGIKLQKLLLPKLREAITFMPKGDYSRALWRQLTKIDDYPKVVAHAILTGALVFPSHRREETWRQDKKPPNLLVTIAGRIGTLLERECWNAGLDGFDAAAAARIRAEMKLPRRVKKRNGKNPRAPSAGERVRSGRKAATEIGYDVPEWGPIKRVRAGYWATDLLVEHLSGMFEYGMWYHDGKSERTLEITKHGRAILDQILADMIEGNRHVVPPTSVRPWTSFSRDGVRLVERARSTMEAEFNAAKMQPAFDALNYLQSTPLAIDELMLAFVSFIWERGIFLKGFPNPKKNEFWNARRMFGLDLETAKQLQARGRFVVPMRFDFRGRINPVTRFYYGGIGAIRSLFQFADPVQVPWEHIPQSRPWLTGQVAGCLKHMAGVRPGSLHPHDRALAVLNDIYGNVVRVAEALDTKDPGVWEELAAYAAQAATKPLRFIAACAELHAAETALQSGRSYFARLPISLDATSSGSQHLCLMAGDEVGGQWVNLVPSDNPRDLYQVVGDDLLAVLQVLANAPDPVWGRASKGRKIDLRLIAQAIIDNGWTDRGIVKLPTMTDNYGVSDPSMTSQLKEAILDTGKTDDASLALECARLLRGKLRDALAKRLPKAEPVKGWLRDCSDILSARDEHLRWTAPDGFPFVNFYRAPVVDQVELTGQSRTITLSVACDDGPVITEKDAEDARRGAAPNAVHAADAALARAVARAAKREDIPLITLHDCFVTVAPYAGRLDQIVREEMSRMYKQNDILAQIAAHSGGDLPLPPEKGNLDPDAIVHCDHLLSP